MATTITQRGAPPRPLENAPAEAGRSSADCSLLLRADTLDDVAMRLAKCWIDGESPVVCVTDPTGLPRDWLRKVSVFYTVILGPAATAHLLVDHAAL